VLVEWRRFGVNSGAEHLGLGWKTALAAADRSPADPAAFTSATTGALLPPAADPYFRAERMKPGHPSEPSFAILVAIAGAGTLRSERGDELELRAGTTALVPFAAGATTLQGERDPLPATGPRRRGGSMVSNGAPLTTDARAKGFEEGAKELGLEYLGQDFSQDEPQRAAAIIKAQLAKNPDIKGVFATNLFSAEGTASGVREAGKSGDVKIVGFDAGPARVEQLEKGDVQALIAEKPADIGAQGVEQAVKALNDEETTPEIGTESVTITKDNLQESQDSLYKSSC